MARRVTFIGVLFFSLILLANPSGLLNDADTQWHVVVGQTIIYQRAFPTVDPYSFTMVGQPWIAKEWLSQVLLALAYGMAGWHGLVVLTAGSVALTLAMLTLFLLRRTGPVAAYLMVGGAFVLMVGHVLARPHALAYPAMMAWFCALSRAADEGRRPSLWLLGVMTLWANLHGGFSFGLLAAGGFALDAVWRAAPDERLRLAREWVLFLLASLASACVTPYGIEPLMMTRKIYQLGQALNFIQEWQPTNFRTHWAYAFVLMCWLGVALWSRIALPPARVLLVVGLFAMALQAARNLELFGLLAPVVVAGFTGVAPVALRQSFLPLLPDRAYYIGCAAWAALSVPMIAQKHVQPRAPILAVGAIEYAFAHGLTKKRVFNDYVFGGGMIARGIPTFIDGRAELFGEAFLLAWLRTANATTAEDPLDVLDRHNIQWTMLEFNIPLVRLLDASPRWRRDFADDVAVIHVRVSDAPAAPKASPTP